MTRPGAPQQYPHGQQQFPPPQQQYPPQYQQGVPWAQPPKRRGKGVLIGVLLAGLAGGGLWLREELDDPAPPPPVDASEDLEKAPLGCTVFDDDEVAPYVSDRIEVVDRGSHEGEPLDTAACRWQDEDDSTRQSVTVTSYFSHANGQRSGTEAARKLVADMVPTVGIDVAHADEAAFFAINDYAARVVVRKRNVVYLIVQNGSERIPHLQRNLEELAAIAIAKAGD